MTDTFNGVVVRDAVIYRTDHMLTCLSAATFISMLGLFFMIITL